MTSYSTAFKSSIPYFVFTISTLSKARSIAVLTMNMIAGIHVFIFSSQRTIKLQYKAFNALPDVMLPTSVSSDMLGISSSPYIDVLILSSVAFNDSVCCIDGDNTPTIGETLFWFCSDFKSQNEPALLDRFFVVFAFISTT